MARKRRKNKVSSLLYKLNSGKTSATRWNAQVFAAQEEVKIITEDTPSSTVRIASQGHVCLDNKPFSVSMYTSECPIEEPDESFVPPENKKGAIEKTDALFEDNLDQPETWCGKQETCPQEDAFFVKVNPKNLEIPELQIDSNTFEAFSDNILHEESQQFHRLVFKKFGFKLPAWYTNTLTGSSSSNGEGEGTPIYKDSNFVFKSFGVPKHLDHQYLASLQENSLRSDFSAGRKPTIFGGFSGNIFGSATSKKSVDGSTFDSYRDGFQQDRPSGSIFGDVQKKENSNFTQSEVRNTETKQIKTGSTFGSSWNDFLLSNSSSNIFGGAPQRDMKEFSNFDNVDNTEKLRKAADGSGNTRNNVQLSVPPQDFSSNSYLIFKNVDIPKEANSTSFSFSSDNLFRSLQVNDNLKRPNFNFKIIEAQGHGDCGDILARSIDTSGNVTTLEPPRNSYLWENDGIGYSGNIFGGAPKQAFQQSSNAPDLSCVKQEKVDTIFNPFSSNIFNGKTVRPTLEKFSFITQPSADLERRSLFGGQSAQKTNSFSKFYERVPKQQLFGSAMINSTVSNLGGDWQPPVAILPLAEPIFRAGEDANSTPSVSMVNQDKGRVFFFSNGCHGGSAKVAQPILDPLVPQLMSTTLGSPMLHTRQGKVEKAFPFITPAEFKKERYSTVCKKESGDGGAEIPFHKQIELYGAPDTSRSEQWGKEDSGPFLKHNGGGDSKAVWRWHSEKEVFNSFINSLEFKPQDETVRLGKRNAEYDEERKTISSCLQNQPFSYGTSRQSKELNANNSVNKASFYSTDESIRWGKKRCVEQSENPSVTPSELFRHSDRLWRKQGSEREEKPLNNGGDIYEFDMSRDFIKPRQDMKENYNFNGAGDHNPNRGSTRWRCRKSTIARFCRFEDSPMKCKEQCEERYENFSGYRTKPYDERTPYFRHEEKEELYDNSSDYRTKLYGARTPNFHCDGKEERPFTVGSELYSLPDSSRRWNGYGEGTKAFNINFDFNRYDGSLMRRIRQDEEWRKNPSVIPENLHSTRKWNRHRKEDERRRFSNSVEQNNDASLSYNSRWMSDANYFPMQDDFYRGDDSSRQWKQQGGKWFEDPRAKLYDIVDSKRKWDLHGERERIPNRVERNQIHDTTALPYDKHRSVDVASSSTIRDDFSRQGKHRGEKWCKNSSTTRGKLYNVDSTRKWNRHGGRDDEY